MDILRRGQKLLHRVIVFPIGASLLFAFPVSTNYQLKDFGYGGGVADGTSSNYALEGIVGNKRE